ncbi:methyltransferase domain-containing protein [Candidatus Fermentibacteria bacterium]|nr:methyltransferase domain-containing protein [Candidatus Fermentibacteria bacterium]
MTEWFENDDFWKDLYPFLFPSRKFESAPKEIDALIELLDLPDEASVLDLCCGPGRHSLELASRGYRVTGVDRTPYLLDMAIERAKKESLSVEFILDDMLSFVRPQSFDLVISMFTSIGYHSTERQNERVFANIFESLRPGGSAVFQTMGKEKLASIFLPATFTELDNGTSVVQLHEVVKDWTRIANRWIVIKNGNAREYAFEHTIYSGQELRQLLLGAGFQRVGLYGNLLGEEYGRESDYLVAVAHTGRFSKN